jgi:hypothetical protein
VTEKITFRVPGKIQYSYMEFTGTAEELGRINYDMAAALFASAIYTASAAERAALSRIHEGQTALLPASQVKGEVQVQELPEGAAEELLKAELGATKVGDTVSVGGLKFTKKQESPFHEHDFSVPDSASGSTALLCECGEEKPEAVAPYKQAPPAPAKKPWEKSKPSAKLNISIDEF